MDWLVRRRFTLLNLRNPETDENRCLDWQFIHVAFGQNGVSKQDYGLS
jgi:hypothetical protein